MNGQTIFSWIKNVYKFNRSLTGKGNKKTLDYFKKINNDIKIKKIKSGSKVFDWVVPKEWDVKDAWVKDDKGKKVINFSSNNLHLVGYSKAVKTKISHKDLIKKMRVEF